MEVLSVSLYFLCLEIVELIPCLAFAKALEGETDHRRRSYSERTTVTAHINVAFQTLNKQSLIPLEPTNRCYHLLCVLDLYYIGIPLVYLALILLCLDEILEKHHKILLYIQNGCCCEYTISLGLCQWHSRLSLS